MPLFGRTTGHYDINGKLVINETEAAVIRRIFDLYLQGIGMQAIAKILNEDSVPRRYGQEKWHHSTVKYVLNNERYMGDALLQKKYTTETLPFRKVRNDGRLPQYYVENSNPPIVSRETYKAVQALMQSRKTENCKRRVYPLTGKLRCPECGRVFRHQVVNGTAYWLCAGRSSGITDCQNRRVREDAVYTAFTDMVIKLKAYRAELLGTLIRQAEVTQSRTSRNRECIRQIDKELADLGAKNLVITRLHTGGALNAAEYTYSPDYTEIPDAAHKTFMGYVRENGSVGIRNEVWIIPTVGCVNSVVKAIEKSSAQFKTANIDGIYSYNHPYGCSQLGGDMENTLKYLAGLINHPNAGAVLVVGLGCENGNIGELKRFLGKTECGRVSFLRRRTKKTR